MSIILGKRARFMAGIAFIQISKYIMFIRVKGSTCMIDFLGEETATPFLKGLLFKGGIYS